MIPVHNLGLMFVDFSIISSEEQTDDQTGCKQFIQMIETTLFRGKTRSELVVSRKLVCKL